MKKILFTLMFIATFSLFSFTSSSTLLNVDAGTDCDALAESWYNESLAGGYSQRDATRVYLMVHEDCFLNGGDSEFTANP